jgi:hypothetical protein
MRRTVLLAVAAASLFACSRELVWQRYADASGLVSVDIPKSWPLAVSGDLNRLPVSSLTFVGEEKPQDEGVFLGATIHVTRVARADADMPRGEPAHGRYVATWIAPADVIFGASPESLPLEARKDLPKVSDATLGGKPAKTYGREYEYVNQVRGIRLWLKLVDVVVRTDKAYYMIEYRAPRDTFEKNRPVFERFVKSFSFGSGA